jgi:hypothetical protein
MTEAGKIAQKSEKRKRHAHKEFQFPVIIATLGRARIPLFVRLWWFPAIVMSIISLILASKKEIMTTEKILRVSGETALLIYEPGDAVRFS